MSLLYRKCTFYQQPIIALYSRGYSSPAPEPRRAADAAGAALGWARFTRHTATAYWQHDNSQPPHVRCLASFLAPDGSAARSVPGTCRCPTSSTLQTPASGAANAESLGCIRHSLRSTSRISTDRIQQCYKNLTAIADLPHRNGIFVTETYPLHNRRSGR